MDPARIFGSLVFLIATLAWSPAARALSVSVEFEGQLDEVVGYLPGSPAATDPFAGGLFYELETGRLPNDDGEFFFTDGSAGLSVTFGGTTYATDPADPFVVLRLDLDLIDRDTGQPVERPDDPDAILREIFSLRSERNLAVGIGDYTLELRRGPSSSPFRSRPARCCWPAASSGWRPCARSWGNGLGPLGVPALRVLLVAGVPVAGRAADAQQAPEGGHEGAALGRGLRHAEARLRHGVGLRS